MRVQLNQSQKYDGAILWSNSRRGCLSFRFPKFGLISVSIRRPRYIWKDYIFERDFYVNNLSAGIMFSYVSILGALEYSNRYYRSYTKLCIIAHRKIAL